MTKQLHAGLITKKEAIIKETLIILQLLVEIFTVYNPSASYKWGILELKEIYALVIHGPVECI